MIGKEVSQYSLSIDLGNRYRIIKISNKSLITIYNVLRHFECQDDISFRLDVKKPLEREYEAFNGTYNEIMSYITDIIRGTL